MLKIKKAFPNLKNQKIENIQKIISTENKAKPKISITIKDLLRKQVIIPINADNSKNFIKDSSSYISNINRVLKNIKLEIIADFICANNRGVITTTNKVTGPLNLQTIERDIKNINNIKINQVKSPRLPQSKSFLKIIGILYLREDTFTSITADMVKNIIKDNYIFNNIILTLKPRVIKVLPKLDMSIVQFNIWNTQNRVKTKSLINRYFNISSYITTIQRANINLGVPQCKNCWKHN